MAQRIARPRTKPRQEKHKKRRRQRKARELEATLPILIESPEPVMVFDLFLPQNPTYDKHLEQTLADLQRENTIRQVFTSDEWLDELQEAHGVEGKDQFVDLVVGLSRGFSMYTVQGRWYNPKSGTYEDEPSNVVRIIYRTPADKLPKIPDDLTFSVIPEFDPFLKSVVRGLLVRFVMARLAELCPSEEEIWCFETPGGRLWRVVRQQ